VFLCLIKNKNLPGVSITRGSELKKVANSNRGWFLCEVASNLGFFLRDEDEEQYIIR